ncbi:hypothetical protein [Solimonas sp. SE-A11]|uniref:hypothetical protein n=1 Tax=Solimonas sp. SE-A11 TaxID=3054954 RepID=UPI00259D0407|nr:hypothetical protein [Solimonas sp. SE-A11]MDM4771773.1 hypothetical protein [Solimonas sp. SE-A11]
MKRLVTVLMLALGWSAQAHEGHEHGEPAATASATVLEPRVALHSERVEVVVVRGAEALLVYADDYSSNAPLEHLAVAVAAADRRVEAQALGEGVYRLPLDLLPPGDALQLQLRGPHWQESFALSLPPPVADESPAPHLARWPWSAAALTVLLALAGIGFARRRRGRA